MNTDTSPSRPSSSLMLEFFNGLRADINSPFNEWVTGEKVGRQPTQDEKLVHFVTHGGHADYRRRFFRDHPEAMPVAA